VAIAAIATVAATSKIAAWSSADGPFAVCTYTSHAVIVATGASTGGRV
jgi:hypothetical protein